MYFCPGCFWTTLAAPVPDELETDWKPMKSALLMSLAVATVLMLISSPAYAYIDPGTGSFLIQGIIAAVVGLGVTIKLFWRRIKAALTGKPIVDDDDSDDPDE